MFVAVILVAPTYVQCAGASEGLAECIRSHILESRVLSKPDPQDVAEVDIPPMPTGHLEAGGNQPPASPPATTSLAPTPGTVAVADGVEPPRTSSPVALQPLRGSIAATAAVPLAAGTSTVELSAPALVPLPDPVTVAPGAIGISGQGTTVPPPVPSAGLVASAGDIDLDLALSSTMVDAPSVRVMPLPGSLHLTASEPASSSTPYIATLAAPSGLVAMSAPPPVAAPPAPIALSAVSGLEPPLGTAIAWGTAQPSPIGVTTVTLTAEAELPAAGQLVVTAPGTPNVPPAPVAVSPNVAVALPDSPAPPVVPPPSTPADPPTASEPLRLLVDDPRFPSVLVLPPPNTGENSSIITLELGG